MDKIDFSKYGLSPVSESMPDFKSYGLEPTTSEQLINKAQQQEAKPAQENDLTNQLQQPGTLSSLNEFGPVMYQNEPARAAMFLGAPGLVPEVAAGGRFISPLINTALRAGAGTAGNIAYQSPNIKSFSDLKDIALDSAKLNSLMEVAPMLARGTAGAAEIYNPSHVYASRKANEINQEYRAARALQRETYRPVFEKYGQASVTEDAKNYLANLGIERRKLYPESKKIYDAFLDNPTFQNLHNFQSKIGGDLRQTRRAGNKPRTTQEFEQYRNSLQDAATEFLQTDNNALNAYNQGSHITRNLVEPFRAMPTLKKISLGTKIDATPQQIAQAIKSGREKITGESRNNVFTAIPEGHPLERHFNDINSRLGLGKTLQNVVPEFWKKFLPNAPGIVQSPLIRNAFRALETPYYIGGRAAIGQSQNK